FSSARESPRGWLPGTSMPRLSCTETERQTSLAEERPKELVGTPRFELGTPCTPCKCATRLRHVPPEKPNRPGRGPPRGCASYLSGRVYKNLTYQRCAGRESRAQAGQRCRSGRGRTRSCSERNRRSASIPCALRPRPVRS